MHSPAGEAPPGQASPWRLLLVLVPAVIATRLPVFLGRIPLDGDESVLGLMARHLLEGRGLPVFFYGQGYGFSLIEAAAGALFFKLFGISETALRASMLLLWTVGAAFLCLAVRRMAGAAAAWIAMLLLLFCPAWEIWSTMARGGYITAFLLTGLSAWVVSVLAGSRSRALGWDVSLGICVGLLAFSQPLFLGVLVPLMVYLLVRRRRVLGVRVPAGDVGLWAAGALATGTLLRLAAPERTFWNPSLFAHPEPWTAVKALPQRVWNLLGGAQAYSVALPAGIMIRLAAWLWCALLLAGLFAAARRIREWRSFPLGLALGCGLAIVLASTLFLDNRLFAYRYLLPVPVLLAILAAVEARARMFAVLAVLALLGCGALVELGRLSYWSPPLLRIPSREASTALVDRLLSRGVGHVYCTDPMYQWNITFGSGERIIARWIAPSDRVPAYPAAVDLALRSHQPVALVAWADQARPVLEYARSLGLDPGQTEIVRDRFFVVYQPAPELLRRIGFRQNGF